MQSSWRAVVATCLLLAALVVSSAAADVSLPPRPICITVDDLPIANGRLHPDAADRKAITDGMMAVFRKHHVPAVGFVTGQNIRGAADDENLRTWLREGHELGNHTWSHPSLVTATADSFIADAERGRRRIEPIVKAGGQPTVRFFRFPFLNEGDTRAKLDAVRAYLARSGQRNGVVTIDDQDWSFEEPWVVARRAGDAEVLRRLTAEYQAALQLEVRHYEASGDQLLGRQSPQVLLLHATEVGTAQWDSLFTWLEQTNHRFVPLQDVLADSAFTIAHAFTGTYGCSLWDRIRADRRETAARDAVTALLTQQAEAWSRGDIDAFCSVYDDSALFVAPSGLARGRQAVLNRYRAKYPDRNAMGTLVFDILEMRPISGREITLLDDAVPGRIQAMSVTARWTLRFAPAPDGAPMLPATGHTSILLRPTRNGWAIVQDVSM